GRDRRRLRRPRTRCPSGGGREHRVLRLPPVPLQVPDEGQLRRRAAGRDGREAAPSPAPLGVASRGGGAGRGPAAANKKPTNRIEIPTASVTANARMAPSTELSRPLALS